MSLAEGVSGSQATDPTVRDPSIRTRVFQFGDKPNMHPVYFTGLYPVRVKNKSRRTSETEDKPESERPKDPWARYSHKHYYAPVEIDPPLNLPNNWSRTERIPKGQTLKAYDFIFVTIPKQFLRSHDSFEFNHADQACALVYHAWCFLIKAIMCAAEGSKSDLVGDRHFFHRPEDVKEGLESRFPGKVQVFGEVLMRHWRHLLADHARDHFPGKTPDQVEWEEVVTDVGFRRHMVGKENFLGLRFMFVATDPKINFGRALQHRQWKNEILTGKASGLEIKTRQDMIVADWRRKVRESQKERPAQKEGIQPSASSASLDRYDLGPEADMGSDENLAQKEQRDEEERVLGDEEPEPEPEGENIGGAGKAQPPAGAAGGGGAAQQDQQQQENERQKEAKRRQSTESTLGGMGIKIPGSDRDPKAYLKCTNYLREQRYRQELAKSGKQVSRYAAPVSSGSKDEDARQFIASLDPKDWFRCLVRTQKDLVEMIYCTLLGPSATKGLTEDQLRNEAQDLGDFKNPLNPRNFFTFKRSVDAITEQGFQMCPEQRDEANYVNAETGEITFPIPFAVWRFPEGEFRLRLLERSKAFWQFSAFEEQLAATERKAVDRHEQRQLRAYGLSMRAHDEKPRDYEEEELLRTGSARRMGDVGEMDDDDRSSREDVTHINYLESEERRIVMANKLASSGRPNSKNASKRHAENSAGRELFMRGLSRRTAEMGIQNPHQRAQREREEHVVTDLIGNDVKDANKLYRRVMAACANVPEDAGILIKLFREHQEDLYKSRMRPGVKGVNEVFAAHAAHLNQLNEKENYVTFKYTGYKNLTYVGSIIAEFLLRARVQLGLTNSHHILLMALWNASPNAYRASRRLGLHMMKAGPPGIGKSYIDKYIKLGKCRGTVMESLHNSNLSKFVEQCTDDRFYMEDEASWATVGDSSRAKTSQEHQQITLMKAWLSNDEISFSVLDYDPSGARYQKRKVVSARGVHSVNVNVLANNKDTANYDRYWIYHIMPWYSPICGQTDLFRFGEASELESWTDGYLWDLSKLDSINYRLAKMVDYRAAAQPNIIDFTLHMAKGMAKLSRYGITADCQNRTMQKACEMATTMTMTAAALQHFSGPWSPSIEEDIVNGKPVPREVPWNEDMLKKARYRLFMTEDIKFYVLSAVYRQILKDYPAWDVVQYIARAMAGFTSSYFRDLFDRDAWEEVETTETLPDGKVRKVTKRKQRFPFTSLERLLKKRENDYDQLPDYVKDEDLLYMQFEVKGMQSRGADTKNPFKQHVLPAFFYYQESTKVKPDDELTREQEEYRSRMARETGSMRDDENGERKEREIPDTVDPEEQARREAQRAGLIERPRATMKHAPDNSYGKDNQAARNDPPPKRVIDPNWLVLPYTLKRLSELASISLSSNAHTQALCIENMLRQLSSKTLMVPVLETMSSFEEEPRFAYRPTEDGKSEIMRTSVNLIKEEFVSHVTIDPATDRKYHSGGRVWISTMALQCFQPMRGLFEFLTAMEYNHTLPMNAVIELPIRGYEGTHYIHNSRPNPDKVLKKRVCKELGSTVIRSLFMEHTTAVFSRMPGLNRVVDMDLDRERIKKQLEKIEKEDEQGRSEWMNQDIIDKSKELLGSKKKQPKTLEERVEDEFQRRKRAKEEARTHISANSQYSQLLRGLASELSHDEQVYQRYHIYEEYEKWMKEEYGKTIKLDESGRSDKLYYPMVMTQRIIPAYVDNSPYYSETRKGFGGELVEYPKQIIEEFQELDRQRSKSYGQEPGAYLLQKRKICQEKIDHYLRMLRKKRNPGGDGEQEDPKSRKRMQDEIAERMGFSMGEEESRDGMPRPGTFKSMLGYRPSDKEDGSGPEAVSDEEDEFRKATQAKRAKKTKEKKRRDKGDESESEEAADKMDKRKRKKKRSKDDDDDPSSDNEEEGDKPSSGSSRKNVQALLPDLLRNDPSLKAKVVRREKPGFF